MEDRKDQAADIPVPAADQAEQDERQEAEAAAVEQGLGSAAERDTSETPAEAAFSRLEAQPEEAPTPESVEPQEAAVAEAIAVSPEAEGQEAVEPQAPSVAAEQPEVQAQVQAEEATAELEEGTSLTAAEMAAAEDVFAAVSPEADEYEPEAAAEPEMTMEDVIAASDDQLARKPIHRGMITSGTVIMLSQEGVIVDVGAKIEGMIPYNQLYEFEVKPEEAARYIKPGDEVQVYVVRADIPNGVIVLSKKRADQERAWNLLHEIHEKKLPVEVEIVEKVRGGLVANLGVRAFLPASQVDVRRVSDLSPYVGKRLKVRIIELNRKRNRVIISRRSIVEEEIVEQKQETLNRLEPGAKLEGEVVEITDFGVFVNLGGVDGLVHRSEIGYGRFNHPREVLKLGDKVNVEVLDMDLERERINLSMKKLITDPWETVLGKYAIGERVAGTVTNLTPFGAFVEIEPGLEGLIHVSEMSWTKRVRHPKEVLKEGDHVEAMILKIDLAQKRISLGLRQTQPDPWSSLPDRYPPGTEVTGPVTGLTDFGVFMEIEEGIEGLIHISELAHERIDNVAEHFKRGDEISAVILNIDPIEQRASLSRKRLLPYTAPEGGMDYAPAAGRQAQGGGRRGRRGGRRSEIDYDYSYAASDAGTRTTTKLGDVYADLFAQFGLADKKEAPKPEAQEEPKVQEEAAPAQAEAAPEPVAEAAPEERAPEPVAEAEPEERMPEAVAEAPEERAPEATAEEPKPEAQEEVRSEKRDEEDENIVDAAEAAALLTAAFRQGRRPPAEPQAEEREEDEKLEESSKA
jgi:small subunit ribosomal protein S1